MACRQNIYRGSTIDYPSCLNTGNMKLYSSEKNWHFVHFALLLPYKCKVRLYFLCDNKHYGVYIEDKSVEASKTCEKGLMLW